MKNILVFLAILAILTAGCQAGESEETVPTQDNSDDSTLNENSNNGEGLSLEGNYVVDSDMSVMTWKGAKITGSSHEGIIKIKEGNINFESDTATTGNFIVDMTSMEEPGDGKVINHLKNEDFFNVEVYPESVFVIKSLENGVLTGDLTIIGNTNEISFPVEFVEDTGKIKAMAKFSIDRTKWGIEYNSGTIFADIGDKAIKDEIDFGLDIVFTKN